MEGVLTFELVFAFVGAGIGVYGIYAKQSSKNTETLDRLARIETKFDRLMKDVEKHNRLVERTYRMESEMTTVFKRIDEHRERIERMENVRIGESR